MNTTQIAEELDESLREICIVDKSFRKDFLKRIKSVIEKATAAHASEPAGTKRDLESRERYDKPARASERRDTMRASLLDRGIDCDKAEHSIESNEPPTQMESHAAHASEHKYDEEGICEVCGQDRECRPANVRTVASHASECICDNEVAHKSCPIHAPFDISQRPIPATASEQGADTKRLIGLLTHLAFSNHGFKPEHCSGCADADAAMSQRTTTET